MRWVNRRTGEAYIYLLNDEGSKYVTRDAEGEHAAYEIIVADWDLYVHGELVDRIRPNR